MIDVVVDFSVLARERVGFTRIICS